MSEANKLRILLNVQGRFHAFDLAKAFTERDDCIVHVATNYPRSVVKNRFNCHPERIYTNVPHGVSSRVANYLGPKVYSICEPYLNRSFGRFALRCAQSDNYDLVHSFTGISEEVLKYRIIECVNTVVRGSAHILDQAELLNEECTRIGAEIDKPSQWMIEREQREYELADTVVVLSTFAYRTFIKRGFPAERLALIPLGVNIQDFKASQSELKSRADRVRSGTKLRILLTGTFSAQKGALDFCRVAEQLKDKFEFTVVGNITPDAKPIVQKSTAKINFLPRVLPTQLKRFYLDNDIFLFTTIQDGFAAVLAQAFAAGLAIVSTENCGVLDVVGNDPLAWIVPIRSPALIIEKLNWINDNRQSVAELMEVNSRQYVRRWSDVANDFVNLTMKLRER